MPKAHPPAVLFSENRIKNLTVYREGRRTTVFTKNHIENLHIYRQAARSESIDGASGAITTQFTPTQKQALVAILKEHNLKASTFIREMMDIHLELFPFKDKIKDNMDLIKLMLERIP